MQIGLIDVDGHSGFPNLPLMKISAWHKSKGDNVEFIVPIEFKQYDIAYMSKVFSFSEDYPYFVNAQKIVGGVRVMRYLCRTAERYSTEQKTHSCQKKLSTNILTMVCTE